MIRNVIYWADRMKGINYKNKSTFALQITDKNLLGSKRHKIQY